MAASPIDRPMRAVLAPVERRIGIGAATRLYAIADQGLSGVANIVAFALLGRALSVTQFGAIGTMIGLQYFVAGFHRSAIVLPFTVEHRPALAAAAHQEDSGWWTLGLALATLLAMATAAVGLAVALAAKARPGWAWMAEPLFMTALISPAMLAWEFARRWLYKRDRADLVALCALAYFVLLVGTALVMIRIRPTAPAAALAWIAASLGALALAWPTLRPARPDPAVMARLVRQNSASAGWLAATNLPYSIYSSASIVVPIGIMVGPVAAAVFSAARTLTNPAISLVSAIDSIDKPRAARAFGVGGVEGLRGVVRRSRRSIALATGLYLSLVAIVAGPLADFVFHSRYAGLEREVRLLALGFFLFGLNLPSETMLIVLRAGRTMLAVRTVTAIATLAGLAIGSPWGVSGMAIAFAITQAANFAMLRFVEVRAATTGGQPA